MKNRFLFALVLVVIAGAFHLTDAKANLATMKAIVVHEYGGPEVLKYEDAPRPEPKENEALVRVIAAGVNPVDALIRSGKYAKFFGTTLPLIPGYDIAGIVEKTGAKITKLKAGDSIYAYVLWGGGYAEYAVATEGEATAKPKSLNYIEAAAVPLAALTAWQALIDAAKLSAGQTVLIHGGSGGVGSMAIQIAKARGAKVIATASTQNQELLKQLGADVTVDYTKTKFARSRDLGQTQRERARGDCQVDRREKDQAGCLSSSATYRSSEGARAGRDASHARQDCAQSR